MESAERFEDRFVYGFKRMAKQYEMETLELRQSLKVGVMDFNINHTLLKSVALRDQKYLNLVLQFSR